MLSGQGVGLAFTPGPGGRPQVMWVRDIEAHCPACGREVLRRYYSATPFHSLTARRLEALLTEAPACLDGACEQCDEPVGPSDAVRWIVHYGFPSGQGISQGFADREGGRRWLLSPRGNFDVQIPPRFDEAQDASNVELATLDRAVVRDIFGRCFNPKEEGRAFARAHAMASAAQAMRLTPGLWILAAPAGHADIVESIPEIGGPGELDRWQVAPLSVGGDPVGGFAGAPVEWLEAGAIDIDLLGVASIAEVESAVRSLLGALPVEVAIVDEGHGEMRVILPEGERRDDDPLLKTAEIAYEAARALLDPRDAARLEIDRLLHALTGLSGPEQDELAGVNA